MKIPSKIKIGGHTYKIVFTTLENELGKCDYDKCIIYLEKDMEQSQKEATLIHEIFHALNSTMDEGLGHMLLDSLSEQFYAVLKDNRLI